MKLWSSSQGIREGLSGWWWTGPDLLQVQIPTLESSLTQSLILTLIQLPYGLWPSSCLSQSVHSVLILCLCSCCDFVFFSSNLLPWFLVTNTSLYFRTSLAPHALKMFCKDSSHWPISLFQALKHCRLIICISKSYTSPCCLTRSNTNDFLVLSADTHAWRVRINVLLAPIKTNIWLLKTKSVNSGFQKRVFIFSHEKFGVSYPKLSIMFW